LWTITSKPRVPTSSSRQSSRNPGLPASVAGARFSSAVPEAESATFEVSADTRLHRLHQTLQAALGWSNSHLFEIRACDVGWGLPSPDWLDGPRDARKVRLIDVLEDAGTKTLRYLYDYGDGWEHTIKVERMIPADTASPYPRLIEASGRCPPEDVGGPWGYAEMLEALADPDHERHAEILKSVGGDFDPHAFDAEPLCAKVAALANRWSRKLAGAKKRRPADQRSGRA
jgi:hypothetical protein